MQQPQRSKPEYVQQKFLLTSMTTFEELLIESCNFWAIDTSAEFELFGHKFENLMNLNVEKDHKAHKVSEYFELLRIRNPLLYLLRKSGDLRQD